MDKRKILKEIDFIIDNFENEKLISLYTKILKSAKITNDKNFEKWLKLECNGYLEGNESFTEDIKVPKYRKIAGYFYDENYSRINFANEYLELSSIYLREGVFELMEMQKLNKELTLEHQKTNELLNKTFNINAKYFVLLPLHLQTVINEISSRIMDWLFIQREILLKELLSNNMDLTIPYEMSLLHNDIQKTCGKLFENGHYRQCILDAFIKLTEIVKIKSELTTMDNTPLMQKAFSQKTPLIKLSEDNDIQQGLMWLFSGAIMTFRNPNAHTLEYEHNQQQTLEILNFASFLMNVLDE